MASCDNLYGNSEEWLELYYFLKATRPYCIVRYMRDRPAGKEAERICYIADIQGWLIKHCKLKWVQDELQDNFEIQRMICGNAHHERKQEEI